MIDPSATDKRIELRFDKVFAVQVSSELFGTMSAIARNISAGGMLIEMADPLPLASVVTVHFPALDGAGEVVARAEVKHHYCFNYHADSQPAQARGIGLRFMEFLEDSEERFQHAFRDHRALH